MTTINDRIADLLRRLGITNYRLAKELNMSPGAIDYMTKGKRMEGDVYEKTYPKAETISLIVEKTHVNYEWLVNGIGEIGDIRILKGKRPIDTTSYITNNETKILTIVVDNNNNEIIPVVPIYAHAGYLRGYSDPEFIRTLPISDGETFKDGTYRDFEVKGDSMEDKIFERDIVRAKFLDSSLYLKDKLTLGTLFVVVTPEKGIILKQVIDHDVSQGKITFHSFNHFHKDFSLHVSEIKEMWYYKQYTSARKFDQYR